MFEPQRIFPRHFVAIGAVGQPHGLKGEINVAFDAGVVPDEGDFVFANLDSTMIPLEIKAIRRRNGDAFIVSFEGYTSEEAVKRFRGAELSTNADDVVDAEEPDDAVYIDTLPGYTVMVDGKQYGEVEGFDESTDNPLLIIRRTVDDREILIPFVEAFVEGVDPDNQVIDITLPAGYEDIF